MKKEKAIRIRMMGVTPDGTIVPGDGEVLVGHTALDIIEELRGANMFTSEYSPDGYIDFLVRNTRKFAGVELQADGANLGERADAVLESLVRNGLAEIAV